LKKVKSLGDTVGCTITVHHLKLTVDDAYGSPHCFCKPVAKYPHDRLALQNIVKEGHPRFFLGSDSAPHPRSAKETSKVAAGVFTGPYLATYLADILEEIGALDKMYDFACRFGREFYGLEITEDLNPLTINENGTLIPLEINYTDDNGNEASVVPFLAGKALKWNVVSQ
jgi:dihydroorotase